MINVLGITTPLFLLIALGFTAARTSLISAEAIKGLGTFVLYLAVPALVLRSLINTPLDTAIEPLFIAAYSLGSVILSAMSILMAYFFLGKSLTESGYFGLGVSLPNSIIIGYPLLSVSLHPVPVHAFTMALIVENFLLIPLAIVMMEWGQSASSTLNWWKLLSQIVRRVFSNPIIIAIIIGIFLSLLDLGLPTVMDRSLETLANSAAAVSLVFIGAILCGRSIQTDKRDIGIMAVFKLLVHPLIVYLAIRLLPDFDPQLQTAAILLAAVPIFTIYPIIGSKYGLSSLGAGALVFATACSFVTISVVLYLLL